jgi:CHC2 zinc finger
VVASGSGPNCHGYWPLEHPLAPREAEAANLRLIHVLAADPNCFDASRILRPPGTWNHKRQPPRPVSVLRLHPKLRFSAGEVLRAVPEVDDSVLRRRWDPPARRTTSDPLLRIAPRIYVADLTGLRPGRDGKVQCPFHEEERPSLHAYPTGDRGWYCYSCRRGGTIYDLAAGVWGLQTRGHDFMRLRDRLLERYDHELHPPRHPIRELDMGR